MSVRPFYWSVRRELWENRAVYLAPLAVAGIALFAFFVASFRLPGMVLKAAEPGAKQTFHLMMPYAASAAAIAMAGFLVAIFYSLSALHGERRDRSLLFWKSLPVSDLTTVLSKAVIPLVVQSVVVLGVIFATHLVMLVWSTMVLLLGGVDPRLLWSRLDIGLLWAMLPYGFLVNVFWDVPFYGWLLLVSAWAKRMTFVWAVAPWFGLALFEFLAFRTRHVMALIQERVFGGFGLAFSKDGRGKAAIEGFADAAPMAVLTHPGLWLGLVFGAACLAACVWLRRRQDPI